MAIDDNTSYELTGAQVKDLANKIKAKAADNIFVGATSALPGSKGLVPAPQAADDTKFLSGDGTWKTAGGGSTITKFYYYSNNLYSDSAHTTPVVYSDVYTAFSIGEVLICGFGNAGLSELSVVGVDSQEKTLRLADAYETNNTIFYLLRDNGSSWSRGKTTMQKKLTAGNNISIDSMTNTISATDTTYSDFAGATSSAAGAAGLVPAPAAGDNTKFLSGDGTWKTAGGGGSTYTAGDGIDITSNVISATNTGLAKILTTDDYNWNSTAHDSTTTPFDCVALWLLPEGYYYNKNQVDYVQYSNQSVAHHWKNAFIIGPKGSSYRRVIWFDYANNAISLWTIAENGGSGGSTGLLTGSDVINDLVTTSNSKPLSATQGKTLKGLIDSLVVKNAGAPTTSTVGTVGKLYEDTTNGKLYICTDATNPYVWEEVGGSAGPVITMQTTDPGEGQPLAANHFIAVYEP